MRHRFMSWAALLCALVFASCGSSTSQTGRTTTQATPTLRPAGTVSATISTGLGRDEAFGIAADDTAVWVHNGYRDTLLRIDPKTNTIVATIPVGAGDGGVALGLGSVWVVSSHDGLISQVDPQTNQVVATIPIEAEDAPQNIAVSANAIWLNDFINSTLIRIDSQTKQVVAKVPNTPGIFSVSSGAGSVWACNHHSDTQGLVRVDPATNQVQAQINPAGDKGFCSAVVAQAQAVWTISFFNDEPQSCRVERIDPATNTVSATIPMPGILPVNLAADAQGVWVIDPGTLYRIDPTTNRLVGSLALPGASGVGFGAGSVWVATESGTLVRVTPAA